MVPKFILDQQKDVYQVQFVTYLLTNSWLLLSTMKDYKFRQFHYDPLNAFRDLVDIVFAHNGTF